MTTDSNKLSRFFPPAVRPFVTRLGLEGKRLRHSSRAALLRLRLRLNGGIEHLYGPRGVDLASNELVVLCLVRNGVPWLPTFLRHYRRLGAKHFVFLDNRSSDHTRDLIVSHDDTTLFSTALPFAPYIVALKRWLVHHFGRGGWRLYVDVDELFDYPFSGTLDLPDFLGYLNDRGYNAVAAQMLDMFSGEPLDRIQGRCGEALDEVYTFYDIQDIAKTRDKYWIGMNETPSDDLVLHTGGVRASAFGWMGSMLTKHPLMRPGGKVRVFPYDDHFVTRASLADVSGLIRHYKFTSSFLEQVAEYTRPERRFNNAGIYERYRRVYSERRNLSLRGPGAREFDSAEALLESGFLVASKQYLEWVEERTGPIPSSYHATVARQTRR